MHEIRDGAGGPVAIEYLDDKAARGDIARHFGKRVSGSGCQQAMRRLITVDRPTDKIMRPGIANFGDQVRHDRCGIDECVRPDICVRRLGKCRLRVQRRNKRQRSE
jgi:hypothetical protein